MTSNELRKLMSEIQRILLLNKEAMPPAVIEEFETALSRLRTPEVESVLRVVLGDSFETLLKSAEKVLGIEKALLLSAEGTPCLSDRLHQSLGELQHRPLILSMIATWL